MLFEVKAFPLKACVPFYRCSVTHFLLRLVNGCIFGLNGADGLPLVGDLSCFTVLRWMTPVGRHPGIVRSSDCAVDLC